MSFRLAHLSDPHIGPLPKPALRDLMGKRLTGYMNWQRRAHIHNMDVLQSIVDDMKAQKPDHIAMTGDIVNLGMAAEFTLAKDWLASLGPQHQVSFVPGNHDAYMNESMSWLAETFLPWTGSDTSPHYGYPYLRQREELAIIGLSSAIPTAPFLASGHLGVQQCEALAELLEQTKSQGHARIILIHHPPYRKGATIGRGLRDSDQFAKIIARHGAELILHGHNHRTMLAHLPGPNGPVPIIGAGSASAVPGTPRHHALYNLYEIKRDEQRWTIKASSRGLLPGTHSIGAIGPIELG
jgi:3',5'-cyclic AMP phosphodiesterase CpdA